MPLKQSERKRAAILQAAREEFLTTGFRNTSMDAVADSAGVSKRTVYNHFENKEALFRAVSVGLIEEIKSLNLAYDAKAPLADQLVELITLEVNSLTSESHLSAFKALLVESFELPGITEQIAREIPAGQYPLENWINAAAQDGRINSTQTEIATKHLYALIKGVFFWPVLVGYSDAPSGTARTDYIKSTVAMFLAHYETKPK